MRAQGPLLLGQDRRVLDPVQLAYGGALEARITRLVATVEGMLIAVLTPLIGWLIDLSGHVDHVLVMVGLGLLVGLVLAMLASALAYRQRHMPRPGVAVSGTARYAAHTTSHRVRFAS